MQYTVTTAQPRCQLIIALETAIFHLALVCKQTTSNNHSCMLPLGQLLLLNFKLISKLWLQKYSYSSNKNVLYSLENFELISMLLIFSSI